MMSRQQSFDPLRDSDLDAEDVDRNRYEIDALDGLSVEDLKRAIIDQIRRLSPPPTTGSRGNSGDSLL